MKKAVLNLSLKIFLLFIIFNFSFIFAGKNTSKSAPPKFENNIKPVAAFDAKEVKEKAKNLSEKLDTNVKEQLDALNIQAKLKNEEKTNNSLKFQIESLNNPLYQNKNKKRKDYKNNAKRLVIAKNSEPNVDFWTLLWNKIDRLLRLIGL